MDVNLHVKDIPILSGAISTKATHLLTGDQKDYGNLFGKDVHWERIVSQRLLVEELQQRGLIQ